MKIIRDYAIAFAVICFLGTLVFLMCDKHKREQEALKIPVANHNRPEGWRPQGLAHPAPAAIVIETNDPKLQKEMERGHMTLKGASKMTVADPKK